MDIILLNTAAQPIYEQIRKQIAEQIVNGQLSVGEQLPSIRELAKELKISVITTKRAYKELENEGFIDTVPGKGTFVSILDKEALLKQKQEGIKQQIKQMVEESKKADITLEQLIMLISQYYEED
ncbi:GntR family transcriptional regulator [Rummeliibacillus suwonensis]|uniref:GntR family transcriptional regulator n=1 Tax=Rummeliibacillus suwonensis TaxID=1306154 RepID=UPI001AB001AF|nr:GntR family transcriptional regulator [Rummeliibacillus suwonensis]MBO2537351.1 GntR family transcriptional regulator [Rummeliibacillus suwonensis]